jgi:hypothetical protein
MNLVEQSVQIRAGGVALDADMAVPEPATGVVLFAHGSGSSRHSPRNRYVAGELQASGLATVLRGEARLKVIAAASHLFSEPGALEVVALLARDWFTRYLKPGCDERRA